MFRDDDVTSTLYKNAYMSLECDRTAEERKASPNKVDRICDVTLKAMEAMNSNK